MKDESMEYQTGSITWSSSEDARNTSGKTTSSKNANGNFAIVTNPINSTRQLAKLDKSATLRDHALRNGYDVTIINLSRLIAQYLALTNQRQSMDAEQMKLTAEYIFEDYSYVSLETVKLFFRHCQKGKFGSDYNRMNVSILFQWFEKFMKEVDHEIIEYGYQEHLNAKNGNTKLITETLEKEEDSDYDDLHDVISRIISKFQTGKEYSGKEWDRMQRVKQLRLDIIKENQHLTTTPEGMKELDRIIEERIAKEEPPV